jgi:hypothetical protein
MTPSKEVATKSGAEALGLTQDEYDALIGQQDDEFDSDSLQTPILKIGQPLTREVQQEQAEPGEFINTLTGEGIGDEIDFVVAYYQKGRFAADRDTNKAFVAFGDVIPEAWEPLVGASYVGTRFDEHPDAEETYKARVNNKEIEWGKGPLISTTHNYTGLALVEVDGETEMQPVRLSLQRTNMPAVRKINSLKRMSMRNKPFWDKVFHLSTERKTFAKGTAFLLVPKLTRDTDEAERLAAVELAQAVAQGRVTDNQAGESAADAPAEPDAKGGLGV